MSRHDIDWHMAEGGVVIRRLRDDARDMAMLAGWLADPRVLEWYEGRDQPFTLDTVRRTYRPRVRAAEDVEPCVIEWQGYPCGYLQICHLDSEEVEALGLEVTGDTFGIDLFIGVPVLWSRGIGTSALKAVSGWLIGERGATLVTIDPRTENRRAIRSYEKAGFRADRVLPAHEWHEGAAHDVLLMVYSAR